MIGSCNCLITSVRLLPTVQLHCPILEQNTAVYAPITFEEIVIVMINGITVRLGSTAPALQSFGVVYHDILRVICFFFRYIHTSLLHSANE